MYKKLPSFILFTVAFIILILSGYQCSTRVINKPGPDILQSPDIQSARPYSESFSDSYPNDPDYYDDDDDRERCPNKELGDFYTNKAMGRIELEDSALVDLNLGRTLNAPAECGRLYLKLKEVEYKRDRGENFYQGTMNLVYRGTCHNGQFGICRYEMRTGYGSKDARYNRWDKRSITRRNVEDQEFHAIFENSLGAYILKLEDVREINIADGQIKYVGGGELYYKMFRAATSNDVHRKDRAGDCYNSGTYVRNASYAPNHPGKRCWFVNTGPYSCRPEGDLLIGQSKDINLKTDDYKCFSFLGTFYNIDIEEAFSVEL